MHIQLKNHIRLGDQVETIEQRHPVEVMEKNQQLYLLFTGEEQERVVMKCDEQELLMTRFSTPKSIMKFLADQEALVTIHTPLGLQHFVTDTKHYQLDRRGQSLTLHYDLKQVDGQGIFASYQMEITWG